MRTITNDFTYQMKRVVNSIKNDYNLHDLNADELQDKIWNDPKILSDFGKKIIERCNEYSGDEIFK